MKIKNITVEKIEEIKWHTENSVNTTVSDELLDADIDIKREIVIALKNTPNKS